MVHFQTTREQKQLFYEYYNEKARPQKTTIMTSAVQKSPAHSWVSRRALDVLRHTFSDKALGTSFDYKW